MAEASPTVARRALARALREYRESAHVTGAKAAGHAGMHAGTLSRIESATSRIQPGNALLLMRYYGASEEVCQAAFDLAHLSRRKGWWRSYRAIPEWAEAYLGLETEASTLRQHRTGLVPELLQTEEYATALASADPLLTSKEHVRENVAVRMKRQERLTEKYPLQLELVVHEAALYQRVGGTPVMSEQLQVLLDRSALSNVSCLILPFSAGAYPAVHGSFTHLSFEGSLPGPFAYGDVVYIEYGIAAIYMEDAEETDHHRGVFNDLRNRSLSENDSRALINEALAEYE